MVVCDICYARGSANDDAGYTDSGGWHCEKHRIAYRVKFADGMKLSDRFDTREAAEKMVQRFPLSRPSIVTEPR